MKNHQFKVMALAIGITLSASSGSVLAEKYRFKRGAQESDQIAQQSSRGNRKSRRQRSECSRIGRGDSRETRDFSRRGDIRPLPQDLCDRLVDQVRRPHSSVALTVFAEADDPSLLFSYYLLDTDEFETNPFTAAIEGINDQAPNYAGFESDISNAGYGR
jgi:hypothetical protein